MICILLTLLLPPNITEAQIVTDRAGGLTSTAPLEHYGIAPSGALSGAPLDLISNVGEFGGP